MFSAFLAPDTERWHSTDGACNMTAQPNKNTRLKQSYLDLIHQREIETASLAEAVKSDMGGSSRVSSSKSRTSAEALPNILVWDEAGKLLEVIVSGVHEENMREKLCGKNKNRNSKIK